MIDEGLPDLPDWIEEKLYINENYDVQLHFYVEPFLETDRPWLGVSKIASEVGKTRQTTRSRLAELQDLEVLNSGPGANGTIYWINDDRSDWPIPPDIDSQSVDESDGLGISELKDRWDVLFGMLTVAVALLASFLISVPVGAMMSGFVVSGSFIDWFLVFGFLLAIGSVILAAISIVIHLYGRWRTPTRTSQ